MKYFEITRKLEFDAGHRIPNHNGQCRHLHGHRYCLEVTLRGHVNETSGARDEGMIMDFGDIKKIMNDVLIQHWDHSFFVAQTDTELIAFLKTIVDHKTTVMQAVPTAENIAQYAFDLLAPVLNNHFMKKLTLQRVRLYETPNCWADVCEA